MLQSTSYSAPLEQTNQFRLQVGLGDNALNADISPFIRRERTIGPGAAVAQLTVSAVDYDAPTQYANGWLDANYDLVNPLPAGATSYVLYLHLGDLSETSHADLNGQQHTLRWDNGAAVTDVTLTAATRNSLDLANRVATFTYGSSYTGNAWFSFTLSGTQPPTNIRFYLTSNETRLNNGEIFDPTWLAQVSQWRILRFMDIMKTNGSLAVNYSDLTPTTYRFWEGTGTTNGQHVGWPIAAIAEVGNRTARPIWICVPHQFTDAAVTSLATDLRDLCHSKLIYVEYSNEVWNTDPAFTQTPYCTTQAAGSGTGLTGIQWAGYRAAQVSEIFRTVFGTDSGAGRWVGVLGTQLANTAVTTDKFTGIDYHIAHDAGAASTTSKLFTHLAVAPYFGVTPTNAKKALTSSNFDTTNDKITVTQIGNGQLPNNAQITFTTDGTLPSPLVAGTTYFARQTVGADAIQISTTSGGSAINLTTAGSGNIYLWNEPGKTLSDWADVSQNYFNINHYSNLTNSAGIISGWSNIAQNRSWWQAQMALSLRGLTVVCYEGGYGSQCLLPLRDNGIAETEGLKLNLAFAIFADTPHSADLHKEMYNLFIGDGGVFPSKFVEIATHSKYGMFGAAQHFGDLNNVVYQTCRSWSHG